MYSRLITGIFASTLFTACMAGSPPMMADTDPLGWTRADTLYFEYSNQDTVDIKSIDILVKYNYRLGEDSLCFNIRSITPRGLSYTEKVCVVPADGNKKSGYRYESRIPYRRDNLFRDSGIYRIHIFNDGESVRGIEALGLDIYSRQQ